MDVKEKEREKGCAFVRLCVCVCGCGSQPALKGPLPQETIQLQIDGA